MARTRPIPISLLPAILLGVFFRIPRAAAEPSPWLEIHSTHFTVITDAGEKKGSEVALRFEQMRAVFATLLMKDRLNEPLPLTILAFKNDKDLLPDRAAAARAAHRAFPAFFSPGKIRISSC